METNDVLRRIRYAFNFKDDQMINIFELGQISVSQEKLLAFYKKDSDEGFVKCSSDELNGFLDGLIIKKRGPKDSDEPRQKFRVNNNLILRKLKIALNFKDVDIIETMKLTEFKVSKSELTALFRNPQHENYKECGDQFLRAFLNGLPLRYAITKKYSKK
ncbi:MAG: DUF1456 family protein [Lentisphaeria bacterium]